MYTSFLYFIISFKFKVKKMSFGKFLNLINGRFENIPKEKTKNVRIFLSSTFSGKINLIFKLSKLICV